jgi:hypothetical protein
MFEKSARVQEPVFAPANWVARQFRPLSRLHLAEEAGYRRKKLKISTF